jgi:hypothetical protein
MKSSKKIHYTSYEFEKMLKEVDPLMPDEVITYISGLPFMYLKELKNTLGILYKGIKVI